MNDPQLTVAREVNLAHRFRVNEETAREWLGRIVVAAQVSRADRAGARHPRRAR
jgi:hypothetical protein